MGVGTAIAMYVVIWWITLFAVLPWGNAPSDEPIPGQEQSAPKKPRLRIKLLVNTALAALVWGLVYWLIESHWLSLRP